MMKQFLTLFALLMTAGCLSVNDSQQKDDTKIRQELHREFKILSAGCQINRDKTVINDKQYYLLQYDFIVEISNPKLKQIDFSVEDFAGKQYYTRKLLLHPGDHTISGSFQSYQSLPDLNFIIQSDETRLQASSHNPALPLIGELPVPEMISLTENSISRLVIRLFFEVPQIREMVWVRLIPPDQASYWSLVFDISDPVLKVKGIIPSDPGKPFFPNGHYILQFNTGYSGIIEKDLILSDYLGNLEGSNYGIGNIRIIDNNAERILFDIHNGRLAEKMKIDLFNEDKELIGSTGVIPFQEELQKKELQKQFISPAGKKIKISYNQLYYYQISIYGQEVNRIRYSSLSDHLPVKFYGFKLFNF